MKEIKTRKFNSQFILKRVYKLYILFIPIYNRTLESKNFKPF